MNTENFKRICVPQGSLDYDPIVTAVNTKEDYNFLLNQIEGSMSFAMMGKFKRAALQQYVKSCVLARKHMEDYDPDAFYSCLDGGGSVEKTISRVVFEVGQLSYMPTPVGLDATPRPAAFVAVQAANPTGISPESHSIISVFLDLYWFAEREPVPGISVTSKLSVSPACDAEYSSPLGACIDAPAQQPHRQIIEDLFDSIGIHLGPKAAADEEIPALVKAQKAKTVTDVLQGVCYASNEAATHVCRECQDSVILQGKWMPYHFTPICRSLVKLMPGLRRKCFRCSSYYTVGTLDNDPVFDFRDLTSEPSSDWDYVFLWASEPRVYRKALVANDTPGTSPPGPERARLFDVTQAFTTFFNPSILEKSLAPFMVQPELLEDNLGAYSDLDALVKEEDEEEPCIEASLGEERSPIIDLSED